MNPRTLQPHHPDNPPPLLEAGPGSPTGMVFGASARFPAKYRRALFVSDWSYGRIYAVYLRPAGASYQADFEFFVSGRPLPTVDLQVGPDGALYLLTDGRGMQSNLYRVTWDGAPTPEEDHVPGNQDDSTQVARSLRKQLGSYHGQEHPDAVDQA